MKAGTEQEVFDRFLLRLDSDRERAGERYEIIRRKLVKFFEWRDCPFPEDHADEVLRRTIDKFASDGEIRDPSTYCYGVARMILLEVRKSRAQEQTAINSLLTPPPHEEPDPQQERALGCLNECLKRLPGEELRLILAYYEQERGAKVERRKQLAQELAIPLNTLRIRAHRMRERLEQCVQGCLRRSME
ncbi:MAG TPA: hypothetical protein VE422_13350 [Terriglobia bacterium]|nr:hypothetical protein [Terriglobia bacterium]